MIPREGRYLVPLKDAVRKPARLTAGDTAMVEAISEAKTPTSSDTRAP